MKKSFLFSVLTAAAVITLTGCSAKPTIDFEQCVSVEFSGYNDEGYAYIRTDSNYIFSLLGNMNTLSAASLVSTFSIDNVENNGELSNGDEITVIVNTDQTALDNAKVKVKNTQLRFIVEGLEEKPKLDIFSDVVLKVDGASPYCTVSAEYRGEQSLGMFSFELKGADGTSKKYYSNGEKVTVSLTEDARKSLERDAVIQELSREFTVRADSAYILSADDLTPDNQTALRDSIDAALNEKIPDIISGSDKGTKCRIISDVSGLSVGSLSAKTCYVTEIENLSFNCAYAGVVEEQGAFGIVNVYKYAYFFYDADISYKVKDFFEVIENTVNGEIVVAVADPIISSNGEITYTDFSVRAATDFQTAYNSRISENYNQLF